MEKMTKEMKDARIRAIMAAKVHEIIAAQIPKEIRPCPDKPVYVLPTGMTGSELKKIKKHAPMYVASLQINNK